MKDCPQIKYHEAAFAQKNNYLNFIHKLGQKGLIKYFKFPGGDFSLWWLSLVAEKPPLKSDTYENLVSFLLSKDMPLPEKQKNKKVSLPVLIARGLCWYLYNLKQAIKIKFSLKSLSERAKKLLLSDYLIVSYFPLLDKKKAQEGVFENSYISGFHHALKENNQNYSHVCLMSGIDGLTSKDSLQLVNRFNSNQNVFLVEEFLKLKHLFLIPFYYLYFMALFLLKKKWLEKQAIYEYEGKSLNIWQIIKGDFYESFCGEHLFSSLFYIFIFRNLTRRLKKGCKIISICEMQWWEKALYIFAKKNGFVTVGFQHSIVPELLLNYFHTADEINSNSKLDKHPLPDYLATVGDTTSRLFKSNGWPAERIFVWGAQRFEQLRGFNGRRDEAIRKENYFVCAFSINKPETEGVLLMLKLAFSVKPKYKIYLKPHPAMQNFQKIVNQLHLNLDPDIFVITTEPIARLATSGRGMIVTESSSCLYAVASGVPVIVPRFIGKLDCNPLSYISDIPVYVYSHEDLRKTCDSIFSGDQQGYSISKNSDFLCGYLYFPGKEDEYFEKIRNFVK